MSAFISQENCRLQNALTVIKEPETLEHLFWQCPAWTSLRAVFLRKWGSLSPRLHECTRHCGTITWNLLNEGVFPSQPIATQLVAELQLVMIRIVRTREKTAVRVSDSFPEHEVICAEGSDPGELVQEVAFQHQSSNDPRGLFPQYPWNFGETVDGGKFFSGKIPSNWRRYSAGGEWFFGVACFEPLRWYWSTLTWPESHRIHKASHGSS